MTIRKPLPATAPLPRAEGTRRRILDAVERLLRGDGSDFSMRDLAAEAGVSFATPFNQFGSKTAIMQAMSAERIALMSERFSMAAISGTACTRVLAAVKIASAVMLEDPRVNRIVIGSLGAPTEQPGQVRTQSRALWDQAIGDAEGFSLEMVELGRSALPDLLAMAFRGVLSFWTAGEIEDAALASRARAAASALLLGFVPSKERTALAAELQRP